ncbi:TetR/AcrR family transcriptional regulator [Paraburkholderia sp.]|uniref:TetR/AcrR family transcriptional regulator n=1 Tax=Paraburkholderia sp. TaxID=1926495 RepID=UPI003D700DA7
MAEKLNPEVIARTALRLLGEKGVDGLTMRALAAQLDVQAATLYWHVASKEQLFRAMASIMNTDAAALMTAADRRAPGRECIRRWARALRDTMLSHRDGARVFAGVHSVDPVGFEVIEAVLDAWRDTGLSAAEAAQRTALLRSFIVGFCIEAQGIADLRDHTESGRMDEFLTAVNPKRFPLVAQALPILLGTTAAEHFELGLTLMLGGPTSAD